MVKRIGNFDGNNVNAGRPPFPKPSVELFRQGGTDELAFRECHWLCQCPFETMTMVKALEGSVGRVTSEDDQAFP